MLFGAMSNLLGPRPLAPPPRQLALSGGLLHSPLHGDPWADLGLLGLAKSAAANNATAPLALRAFITESLPPLRLPPLE